MSTPTMPETLFQDEPPRHSASRPMPSDEAVRAAYEAAPGLSSFSRKPISYELAAQLGTTSHARAYKTAQEAMK